MRKIWLSVRAWSLLAGCAGLPRHVMKYPTVALQLPQTTTLGRIVAGATRHAQNLSGFRLLTSGEEAFASLIALADHAERTLDIQYYIIHQDESARICCITCASPRTAACGCACWSTTSIPPARTGASCI